MLALSSILSTQNSNGHALFYKIIRVYLCPSVVNYLCYTQTAMMIGIGAILVIIGAALAAWQWTAVWMLLRGGIPLFLLALGALTLLIGYSQLKAKRFCKKHVERPTVKNDLPS